MTRINQTIKNRRRFLGWTQDELAEKMGFKSRSSIAKIEAGDIDVTYSKIFTFAEVLETTPEVLMGFTPDPDLPQYADIIGEDYGLKVQAIPLVGSIAAGTPILAAENIEDAYALDEHLGADFCLRIKGDSMIDEGIFDGDIAFIQQQANVENGEIAAVIINDEATLKRFYRQGGSVILQPANSYYEPIVIQEGNVHIAGKLVAVLSIRK